VPHVWIDRIYQRFSFISTHILLGQIFLGSAEADIGSNGKLKVYLMASCVRNTRTKNY